MCSKDDQIYAKIPQQGRSDQNCQRMDKKPVNVLMKSNGEFKI